MARPAAIRPQFLRSFTRGSFSAPQEPLLQLLLRNPELSPEEAANELRWIRQEAEKDVTLRTAHMLGSKQPSGAEAAAKHLMHDAEMLSGVQEGLILGLVKRRAKGEPLQYVLGNTDFGPLNIICKPPTLIPRPETAYIFEQFATELMQTPQPLTVLDLCTGSGCIPLLLSHLLGAKLERAIGVDIATAAVDLAKHNAADLGITNVSFVQADIFSPSFVNQVLEVNGGERYDVITANPPYITAKEYEALPLSVRKFEDPAALLGDIKVNAGLGLSFYDWISRLIPQLLEPTGRESWSTGQRPRIAMEIGVEQAEEVSKLMKHGNCSTTGIWRDQYGRQRAVTGYD